jgi:hypothetical protein
MRSCGREATMNRILPHCIRALVSPFAVLIFLAAVVPCSSLESEKEDALLGIEASLRMESLSKALWPSWDISKTPVALLSPDGQCFLINHPRPPAGFERVRDTSVRMSVHRSSRSPEGDRRVCRVGGVPTALVNLDELGAETLPVVFEAAFDAYEEKDCLDRTKAVVLVAGYPAEASSLVLADIECGLLLAALNAPDDSVRQRAEEFAAIRRNRRMRMGGRYTEYERRIEFTEGIAAYLAEKCREEGASYLEGRIGERLEGSLGEPGELLRSAPASPDLGWYRHDRFRWTGALTCLLLDRLYPEWKDVVWSECIDPYEVLWRRLQDGVPLARQILARVGYDELVASRSSAIEGMKSDAERHYEQIAGQSGKVLTISTHLLASGEVSFESASIEKVDAHREVHNRILKIEYSWGTRFECIGSPVAVVLGEDEFDFRRLILRLPEEYSIVLDGEPLVPEAGVYQFMESLVFKSPGISIEAHAGTVMVGENGVSLILHR